MKTNTAEMQKIKPNKHDAAYLRVLAKKLKAGNQMLSQGKKLVDNSKKSLGRWLKDNRDIELEMFAVGEMVLIEEILLFEMGKQNKFDEAGFAALHPELYEEFKRDLPVKKFKALVK